MSADRWKSRVLRGRNTTGCAVLDKLGAKENNPDDCAEVCLGCPLPKCMIEVNKVTNRGKEETERLTALYTSIKGGE